MLDSSSPPLSWKGLAENRGIPCFSNSGTRFWDRGGLARTQCTCSFDGRPAGCTLSEIRSLLHLEGPQVLLVQGDVPKEGSWKETRQGQSVPQCSTDSLTPWPPPLALTAAVILKCLLRKNSSGGPALRIFRETQAHFSVEISSKLMLSSTRLLKDRVISHLPSFFSKCLVMSQQ